MQSDESFDQIKNKLDDQREKLLKKYIEEFENNTPRAQRSYETLLMFTLSRVAKLEVCLAEVIMAVEAYGRERSRDRPGH